MDIHLLPSRGGPAPQSSSSSIKNEVDNRIEGRLALITGASGGIGAACARDLASQGVHLALTYSKNLESVQRLAAEIRESVRPSGPTLGNTAEQDIHTREIEQEQDSKSDSSLRISIHRVDLASVEEIDNLFQEIKKEHAGKPIDILVSNAGYGKRIVDISDIPLSEFEHTINVNLRASFLLVKGVVEAMKAQKWGRIVFISSIAAYGGGLNGCHYAASKGGLLALMRNLSTHLAAYSITVNDIAPAMVGSTGMIPNADAVPGLTDKIPLHRLCEPQEVANAVRMFVTTGFATGQSLIISGGLK